MSMKALYSEPSGDSYSVTVTERPKPTVAAGQALIRVHAAGINPSDCSNAYKNNFRGVKPLVVGRDYAGVVVEAEDKSLVGQEVWGTSGNLISLRINGTHAEYVALPQDALSRKPKNLSWAQAGAAGTPFTTALLALDRAHLRPGKDAVLVLGATGSAGGAVVDIARAMGNRVITASRRDTTDINTSKDPELKKMVELTNGEGVDVVVDAVGSSDLAAKAMDVLCKNGRYSFFTAGKGSTPELHVNALQMYRRNQTLAGINSGVPSAQEMAKVMDRLTALFEEGGLKPVDESNFNIVGFDKLLDAYAETMKISGKKFVLVIP